MTPKRNYRVLTLRMSSEGGGDCSMVGVAGACSAAHLARG